VEELWLVLASGEQLERLVFALAVSESVVEVDPARHLEQLVLAPEQQERLVLPPAVEVDPERHLDQLVLAPGRQQRLLLALALEVDPEQHLEQVILCAGTIGTICHGA